MKKILLVFFMVAFIGGITNGQTKREFKKHLQKDVKSLKEGKIRSINASAYRDYIKSFPSVVLKETEKYGNDSLYELRSFAGDIYFLVAKQTQDTSVRNSAVYLITKQCANKDKNLRQRAANHLKQFPKQFFNTQARKLLASYFQGSSGIYKYTARITGYLEMKEQIPVIKQLLTDPSLPNDVKWELQLTLARLGDEEAAYYCTNFVMMQGINDRLIRYLFRDLIYTRTRIALDYIIGRLYDEEPYCRSANPYSSKNIVCGYRIMELLAPVIKDFPYDYYSTTGQLKTSDYDEALKVVRKWFKNNPDYVIKTDRF